MYDYYLGGKDNFAVDREAAEEVLAAAPEVRILATENRAFLQRAVRFLAAEAGIRQFIDLGTGLPTQGNVHEVAHTVDPTARIVYIDNDPIVRVHAQALVKRETTVFIEADMRRPQEILDLLKAQRLIRFDEPVAVLFVSVLHFITKDEDPNGIVGAFRDAAAPGSYVTISHITNPEVNPHTAEQAAGVYQKRVTSPAILRSRTEILTFFDGYDLVDPGLVYLPEWRPHIPQAVRNASSVWMLAGVGRKR
jgi:hypothetical protein